MVSTDTALHLDRPQILDATLSCLEQRGYEATTIREIARRLGCAVGTIYRYFSDKRELLAVATQRRFDPVADLAELGSPLAVTAREYHHAAASELEAYQLMWWLGSVTETSPQQRMPEVVQRIVEAWTRQLGDGAAATRLWSMLHGSAVLGTSFDQVLVEIQRMDHRVRAAKEVARSAEARRQYQPVEAASDPAPFVSQPAGEDPPAPEIVTVARPKPPTPNPASSGGRDDVCLL